MRSPETRGRPLPALAVASLLLGACGGSANTPPAKVCAGPGTICAFAGNGDPAFTGEGEPVALAELAAGELRPFRVFNFGTG